MDYGSEKSIIPVKEIDLNYTIPKKINNDNIQYMENVVQSSIINESYYNLPHNDPTYTTTHNPAIITAPFQDYLSTLKRKYEEDKTKRGPMYMDSYSTDLIDSSLPVELRAHFQPLYCKLCCVQLSSNVDAKIHYSSKNHDKKVKKFLIEYSERTGEPLHKRAKIQKTKTNEDNNDPKYFHCDICDLPLTGKLHAESHYMGKNHQKALHGKAPAGKGYFNSNSQWIRTSAKKIEAVGDNFGLDFQKCQLPVEQNDNKSNYSCTICNVNVTSQGQLDMHIAGQKHKKKVNAINLNAEPSENLDNDVTDIVFGGNETYSKYRTPSGLYYCKNCNVSLNSELQFKQHLGSKKHIKKSANQD